MDTYSHAYGNTGHYRRPGTQTSYCGRDLLPEPNTAIAVRVCGTCTKGEQRDRVEAEQVVADRDLDGPTLAVRAGVRYCLVGTGRRVHYSNNDDTLCGRQVTEYTDGLDERHNLLCAPCIKGAEKRAYARALAAASPLAAAAVDLAETVEQASAEQAPAAVRDEPSDWWTIMDPATGEEIARVHGETWQDMTPRAEALPEVRAVIRRHKGFSRRRLYVSELTPEQRAEQVEQAKAAAEQAAPAPTNAFEQGAAGQLADRVDLAETVICPTCHAAKGARCITRAGKPARETHGRRVEALEQAAGITQHRATAAREAENRGGWVVALDRKAEDALLTAYAARITARAQTADDQSVTEAVEKFDRAARAVDAVEHAEQVEAGVETVEDAEALYAAALVTEAEADDHTWRGAWIGEQATDALFVVDGTVEQGALFAPGPDDCRTVREPIAVRASFLPADLDQLKTKAATDRAAYRAETDDRIAAECAAHGVAPSQGVRDRIAARTAEQAPARRVIEGVVVSHNGTATGSTPVNASHPNVIAARAALDCFAVATLTDHHDVTEPTTVAEQRVRGYLIEPREGDRVAVYWLEAGRIIRRDTPWHGPALDCLADRLVRRGWTVEPMHKSSECVFAHRPPAI